MNKRRKQRKQYHYLTALRCLGFVGVSLFHRFSHIFPGGYLAVIIFLILAGFLSAKGYDGKKNIDSKSTISDFLGKFIRIMAPVYFMMAVVMVFSLFNAREIFDDSIGSVLPVALSFENIVRIINKQDYFNQLGNFNIFNHMWYVSLYMQFSLIFSIAYLWLSKKSDSIKALTLALVSIVSFACIIIFAKDSSDISRIYYGIDTRISAFSLGAVFYYFGKNLNLRVDKFDQAYKIVIGSLILVLIIPFFLIDGRDINSYKLIFVLYTIGSALLVLSLYKYEDAHSYTDKKKLRILTYIGQRSYHLYIWQYVVQVFVLYFLPNLNNILSMLIEIILIFLLAEVSYQLFKNRKVNMVFMLISALSLVGLLITSAVIGNAKEKEIAELRSEITANEEAIRKRNEAITKEIQDKENKAEKNDDENSLDENNKDLTAIPEVETLDKPEEKENLEDAFTEKSYDDFNFTENELEYLKNLSITSVGDSVIINADSYIRKFVPNFYLDGEVGRDMVQGPGVLGQVKQNVGLGEIILVSLGSNGSANASDMDQIMDLADGRDVYFVNTSHTQSYMDFVNNNIADYCQTHDKAHLVDWRGWIMDKPDYLAADRTHPNIPGSDGFAKLIMRKILNVNKVEP